MQEERPLPFTQVLADEYKTLRGADVAAGSQEEFFRKTGRTQSPLSALCISGGGIRSATFALGTLQALAKQGVLQRFDYLSTVSGGGYIGSWLTSWINRAGGLDKIVPQLSGDAHAPMPSETDPIRHLREYNSYLSPRLGAFSADTWTLVATVVRNIMLNWLVLVPLLLGALMIPRALLSVIMLGQLYFDLYGTADPIAKSPIVIYGLPVAGAVFIAMVFFNIGRYLPGAGGRSHSRLGAGPGRRRMAALSHGFWKIFSRVAQASVRTAGRGGGGYGYFHGTGRLGGHQQGAAFDHVAAISRDCAATTGPGF